eukprot:COSAG02_NODE_4739_length_5036_cov_10.879684_3_plen_630_part_00
MSSLVVDTFGISSSSVSDKRGQPAKARPHGSDTLLARARVRSLIDGLNSQAGGGVDVAGQYVADGRGSLSMRGLQELEEAKAEAARVEHETRETFRRCLAEAEASRVQLQEATMSQRERRNGSAKETMFAIEYHAKWRDTGDFGVVRKGWLQDLRLLPPGQTRSSLHRSTWQQRKKVAVGNAALRGALRQQTQELHSTVAVQPAPEAEPEPEPEPVPEPEPEPEPSEPAEPPEPSELSEPEPSEPEPKPSVQAKPPAPRSPSVRSDDTARNGDEIPPENWEPLETGTGSVFQPPSPGPLAPPAKPAPPQRPRPPSDRPTHREVRPAASNGHAISARPAVWEPLPLTPRSSHRPPNPPRASHTSVVPQATLKRGSQYSSRAQTDGGIVVDPVVSMTRPVPNEDDQKKVSSTLRPVALPRATLQMSDTANDGGDGIDGSPRSSRRDHAEMMPPTGTKITGMNHSQRASQTARSAQSEYRTDFSVAPFSLGHVAGPASSARGRTSSFHRGPRVAANASMTARWNVNDNLSDSEWSLTLDSVIARALPDVFGGQVSVVTRAAHTPELQRMLRSPAPPLAPRMIGSMREHQERGRLGRFDKIATHTAQPLKHHAVDSAEPFVRGGPGMESLPRF